MTIFLALSAAVWLPYGLYCLALPGFLADAAGVAAATPTGTTELRAMYGGLQAGIGTFALVSLWRPALRRPALLCILFLTAGLLSARLLGAGLDASFTSYTVTALGFEGLSVAFAAFLLRGAAPA
ncbi:MAG: DUF4345 family protein [Myxococcota bacterium]